MSIHKLVGPRAAAVCCYFIAFLALITGAATARAQATSKELYFARANTFSIFGAYSGDSSHILMGNAENRKLLSFGVAYSRRLLVSRIVDWQYNGELVPVALESDPYSYVVYNQTLPTPATFSYTSPPTVLCATVIYPYSFTLGNGVTYSGTATQSCKGREWTIGEGISPAGFQWNFLPLHRTQPFLIGHGGYMYSTQPIPVADAGSFNFTFDFGAGFELFRSRHQSVRAEYRYHHISNHGTATENPGIDSLVYYVTYSFGR
ncbi:MAG: acyloxyacyl hydrolase [Terracidiphilus sp.]